MLSANPLCEHRLALDREARAIEQELLRSPYRNRFELVTCWAVEPLDLLAGLRTHRPTVVHFSGHGVRSAARGTAVAARDVTGAPGLCGDRSGGLCFQQPDGHIQIVSPAALKDTFRAVGSSVKLVILNACYTARQAQALRAHVDCVIGSRGTIRDEAATHFAIGMYGGIAGGESVASAYEQGLAAISLKGLCDQDRPQLKVRTGIDAHDLVLIRNRRRRRGR